MVGQGPRRSQVAGRIERLRGDGQIDQPEPVVDVTASQRVVGDQVEVADGAAPMRSSRIFRVGGSPCAALHPLWGDSDADPPVAAIRW